MKVADLLVEADELEELTALMQLRATGSKLSQEQAEKAFAWLKEKGYRFKWSSGRGTAKNPGPGHPYLNIIASTWKHPGWRSGGGAIERGRALGELNRLGFQATNTRYHIGRTATAPIKVNLPHVYFW